jgi:hypothetical protein
MSVLGRPKAGITATPITLEPRYYPADRGSSSRLVIAPATTDSMPP